MGRCPTPRQGEVLPAPPARLRRAKERCRTPENGARDGQSTEENQASKLLNFQASNYASCVR